MKTALLLCLVLVSVAVYCEACGQNMPGGGGMPGMGGKMPDMGGKGGE